MPSLPPFKLERYFAAHEFSAPHLLCCSDCEALSTGALLEMEKGAEGRLHALRLGYTESPGSPELRGEIAALYDGMSAEKVLVHAGAEEAILCFMNAVLAPGDHVVVHTPCYQSLAEVARGAGAEVSAWRADESNGWALDLDELRDLLRPSTRVIVVNCPHNPTGYLVKRGQFEKLVELADSRGIVLLSDEVYRYGEHDGADRLPAACELSKLAVSLGVLSKSFGLPGLRIGWIATRNRAVYEATAAYKDYTTICNSAPSELLAAIALRGRETVLQHTRSIVAANLLLVDGLFERRCQDMEWVRPRAGCIGFARIKRPGGAERFCAEALEGCGVLLLPSTVYDWGDTHVRIGFGRADCAEALERLESWM